MPRQSQTADPHRNEHIFPQVLTVISLPAEEDELSQLVDELSGDLAGVQTVQDVAQAKRFNPKVSASLGPYADGDIFDRLQRIRDGAKSDATRSPKLSEFDTFASGRPEIGANHPTAKLYAQTLPRDVWAEPDAEIDLSAIKNLVAVASTGSRDLKPHLRGRMAISKTFS